MAHGSQVPAVQGLGEGRRQRQLPSLGYRACHGAGVTGCLAHPLPAEALLSRFDRGGIEAGQDAGATLDSALCLMIKFAPCSLAPRRTKTREREGRPPLGARLKGADDIVAIKMDSILMQYLQKNKN